MVVIGSPYTYLGSNRLCLQHHRHLGYSVHHRLRGVCHRAQPVGEDTLNASQSLIQICLSGPAWRGTQGCRAVKQIVATDETQSRVAISIDSMPWSMNRQYEIVYPLKEPRLLLS